MAKLSLNTQSNQRRVPTSLVTHWYSVGLKIQRSLVQMPIRAYCVIHKKVIIMHDMLLIKRLQLEVDSVIHKKSQN